MKIEKIIERTIKLNPLNIIWIIKEKKKHLLFFRD